VAIPLLAAMALVFDGSTLLFDRRQVQAAADSASWGGAHELARGNTGNVVTAGKADATRMGFDDTDAKVTVTINNPPLDGLKKGDAQYVEAIVSYDQPATFARMFNLTSSIVTGRSVSGIQLDYGAPCVLALNTTARGAITVSGGAQLNAPDCDVISSSNDPGSITANGGGCVTAANINYPSAGGTTTNGGGCLNGNVGPTPPPGDPYCQSATTCMAEPVPGDYPQDQNRKRNITSGTVTLAANSYHKGGVKITGGDVTLAPGIHVFDGLEVSGGATLSGDGVMIYNTGAGLKNIQIASTVTSHLSAMTSGPYANILFFNTRTVTGNGGTPYEMTINGAAGSYWDGTIYVPSHHLDFVGNTLTEIGTGGDKIFSQVIADTIRFTGTSAVNLDWNGSGRVPTTSRISMVE